MISDKAKEENFGAQGGRSFCVEIAGETSFSARRDFGLRRPPSCNEIAQNRKGDLPDVSEKVLSEASVSHRPRAQRRAASAATSELNSHSTAGAS